jgi:hypothetical protein
LGPRSVAAEPPPTTNEPAPWFYLGQDYGSEAQFSPATVFVSVGFASWGHLGTTSLLGDIDFADNAADLVDIYLHPVRSVQESWPGETAKFFGVELISPANSLLHFLGEGMLSRKLAEWYEARGIDGAWARALGIATVVVSQQANELVEVGVPEYDTSEPVADLVWNTAGLVAFSFDGFARLFADTSPDDRLQMYFWPGQAVIDVRDGALFNHGESYLFRASPGEWTSWRLALRAGLPTMGVGVSIPLDSTDWLTVLPVARMGTVKPRGYEVPAMCDGDMDITNTSCPFLGEWSVNVDWDREGSLMASLGVRTSLTGVSVNVYPGVIDLGPVDLGAYAILDVDDASSVGLTMSYAPVVPGARW